MWIEEIFKKGLIFILVFFILAYMIFPGNLYEPVWIFSSLLLITIVFSAIRNLNNSWSTIPEKDFITRLFWFSFFLRLFTMTLLYLIARNTEGWDMFYYVGAKDPQRYYRVAWEASVIWESTNISDAYLHILESYFDDISDTGFSFLLSIPMRYIGTSPYMLKTLLCIVGSICVLRGYKLTSILFESKVARLAAILLMLYPTSWFYSSVFLKEIVMVYIILEAIIGIVSIQRSFSLVQLIKVLVLIIGLFFFRSAISILMAMVLLASSLIHFKSKHPIINFIIAAAVFIGYLYFLKATGRYDEYYQQYTDTEAYTESRISYMETINPYVAVAGTPVFAVLAFMAPFPSIVKVPIEKGLSHNEYNYHVAGGLYWISIAFFCILGLYYAFRYRRTELIAIWAFVIGYQFILLRAMLFTSVRFSYPAKPLLIILAAYGIYKIKDKKWFTLYLAFVILLLIGWNYVRFKGRGA